MPLHSYHFKPFDKRTTQTPSERRELELACPCTLHFLRGKESNAFLILTIWRFQFWTCFRISFFPHTSPSTQLSTKKATQSHFTSHDARHSAEQTTEPSQAVVFVIYCFYRCNTRGTIYQLITALGKKIRQIPSHQTGIRATSNILNGRYYCDLGW